MININLSNLILIVSLLNGVIISHLNMNSLRNKFDLLTEQVKANVDVLVIYEATLGSSFPEDQFRIPGFSTPFRRIREQFGESIMVFVREDIPSKLLSLEVAPIENLYIELRFRNKKWPLNWFFNLNRNNISNHLNALKKSLDLYTSEYENGRF